MLRIAVTGSAEHVAFMGLGLNAVAIGAMLLNGIGRKKAPQLWAARLVWGLSCDGFRS